MNEIYWITRLDGIQSVFAIIVMAALIAAVILFILFLDSDEEDKRRKLWKQFKVSICCLSVLHSASHLHSLDKGRVAHIRAWRVA